MTPGAAPNRLSDISDTLDEFNTRSAYRFFPRWGAQTPYLYRGLLFSSINQRLINRMNSNQTCLH
jgi:hypothetical protein